MSTAIDTNILLDIFGADAKFGPDPAQAVRRCLAEGTVVACPVGWTEAAVGFSNEAAFLTAMHTLGIEFSEMSKPVALSAGDAWRQYRASGGKRNRVVADFLIGAHAVTQCERLLTRDRGFYRSYFKGLVIIDPSQQAGQ